MDIVIGIGKESCLLLTKMAPYLLFGFFVAGIIHMFLKPDTIARHLGTSNFGAVVKASLFGIPLPLCSCGVIPAALALRKEGASKSAVLSFLISTPTTGIDSICATFALLGGVFTAYRVCATFIAALFVGVLANLFFHEKPAVSVTEKKECRLCDEEHSVHEHPFLEKVKGVFTYAFGTLLHDAGKWLLIGIIIGGSIAYFLPHDFIETYIGNNMLAIVIMFVIGIPMYVCASGSIPIAAALMLKGLNPGAAFAFLFAGPATNTVTMAMVYHKLGKGALVLYLTAIAAGSIVLGLFLDTLWQYLDSTSIEMAVHQRELFPVWFEGGAAFLLLILITVNSLRKTPRW